MIAIIDFETTGLPNNNFDCYRQPGITQIGLLVLNQSLDTEFEFSKFIDPEKADADWSKKAIEVTGINQETVKDAPTFFAVFPEFAKHVTGCDIWVGYNNPFDKKILAAQLERYGFSKNFPWPPNDIDMMRVVDAHYNDKGRSGKKRHKLTEAFKKTFGHDFEGAHDALGDCYATADLLRKLGTRALEAIYG